MKAQREMDDSSHSYHDSKARLFQLIDFNDAFVSLALALSPSERAGFVERLHTDISQYCVEQGSPMFSDEQFEAITRGLSREVAVYLGAIDQGFTATMTSRAQDAMGVDMIITSPRSGKSLNIDCKTASAYRFRIKDLVGRGRMTEEEAAQAERRGFAQEVNGQGDEAISVTLLRVDPNEMSDIKDFVFTDPSLFRKQLEAVFAGRS